MREGETSNRVLFVVVSAARIRISGIVWKSYGDDIRRKYDFRYDAANRLLKGDFEQQNTSDHASNQVN